MFSGDENCDLVTVKINLRLLLERDLIFEVKTGLVAGGSLSMVYCTIDILPGSTQFCTVKFHANDSLHESSQC